jgi:phage-related protein
MGILIYLGHTRPDISFTVSTVSCYMHDPRKCHMDAIYHIMWYLKSTPGNDLIFRKNENMNIEALVTLTELIAKMTGNPYITTACSYGTTWTPACYIGTNKC